MDQIDEGLAAKFRSLLPHLDERQRRLVLGAEAWVLGHGGIRRVASGRLDGGHCVAWVSDLEVGDAPFMDRETGKAIPYGIYNTRVAVAQELGLSEIPANIHMPEDALPEDMIGRFGSSETWGDALVYRTSSQRPPLGPTGTPTRPRMP
jgi:hypothetical protein